MRTVETSARLAALALALGVAACSPDPAAVPTGTDAGAPPVVTPACRAADEFCDTPAECCTGKCSGVCQCVGERAHCGTSADCCVGLNPLVCNAGVCVRGCRPDADPCEIDLECCSGNCDATGHCAPPCRTTGETCAESKQCCEGRGCGAGTCTPDCKDDWDGPCTSDNECCSGYFCRAGQCQLGVCGTGGQRCESKADCCTALQGGKEYYCGGYQQCQLRQPGEPCASSAECLGAYPCRDGYCHWPDGAGVDGTSCLDGQECRNGHCTSTEPGMAGRCCSGAGASCTVGSPFGTQCCWTLGLSCGGPDGAQTCRGCLDWTNSGPDQPVTCTVNDQCCARDDLRCDGAGKCCTQRGSSCASDAQCCTNFGCGSITTYEGTRTSVCCGRLDGGCLHDGDCCDGFKCAHAGNTMPTLCKKTAGGSCTADDQCTDYAGCRIRTPPEGVCCSHGLERCDENSDCCSGLCLNNSCVSAQSYGDCLSDLDCSSRAFGEWMDPICGANANVGEFRCCPAPGDACSSPADCCEAGDLCAPPLSGPDLVTAVCCRAAQAACTDDEQCCTGICDSTYTHKCCAFPYMTSFACASDADCCDGTGTYARAQCDLATSRCCWKAGQNVGANNAATCCSGRVDGFGMCR